MSGTDSSLLAIPNTTRETLALIRRVEQAVFGGFLDEQGSNVV